MAARAPTADESGLERDWWLGTLAVLTSPRPVFAWLRLESTAHAEARQEPVLALVLLAGIAGILSLDATGAVLDYPTNGNLPIEPALLPVVLFVQGALYGTAAYWLGGALLYLGLRGAGGTGSYRRARHILAYAAAPLVLALVAVLPLELAVYGLDVFRTGGTDAGAGAAIFHGLQLALVAWSSALLVVAVRTVHGWSILRVLGSLVLAGFALVALSLVVLILSAG